MSARSAVVDLGRGLATVDGGGPPGYQPATYELHSVENAWVGEVVGSIQIFGDGAANDLEASKGRTASSGPATLSGGGGDDTLIGSTGDDRLDGGDGYDTAIYSGAHSDYTVTVSAGVITVQDLRGGAPDGRDTLVGVEHVIFQDGSVMIQGTDLADTLHGSTASDTLYGLGGDDRIFAYPAGSDGSSEGANSLYGGDGNDSLVGGRGADLLDGGAGADSLVGSDMAYLGAGADSFFGGGGTDWAVLNLSLVTAPIQLDLSNPNITATMTIGGVAAGTFNSIEQLDATLGAGNDSVVAGTTFSNLYGGAGNDTLVGSAAGGLLDGGPGDDRLDGQGLSAAYYGDATAGVAIDLNLTGPQNTQGAGIDTLINLGGVDGSPFSDTITGSDRRDLISVGNGGNDLVHGGGGDDLIALYPTGSTISTLYGDGGADTFLIEAPAGSNAKAQVFGGDGSDTLTLLGAESVSFDGGAGADRIEGVSIGPVTLTLGAGSDTVSLRHDGSTQAGVATLSDFQAGIGGDVIDLSPFGVMSQATVAGRVQLVQIGADAVVQVDPDGGGDSYVNAFTLSGVRVGALTAYNFGGLSLPVTLDVTPPSLVRLDLPDAVSLAYGEQTVGLTVGATDAGVGVSSVTLVFDHDWRGPNGPTHATTLAGGFSGPGGLASGALTFEFGTVAGVYSVVEADVADLAGNVARYSAAQLAGLGLDTSFQLSGPPPDVTIIAPASVMEGGSFSLAAVFTGAVATGGAISVSYATQSGAGGQDTTLAPFSEAYQITPDADETYRLDLGTYTAVADGVREGTEALVLSVSAPGHVFSSGLSTTTVTIAILDSDDRIAGTAAADTLQGTAGDDHILAGDGNDTLVGGRGADILDGGNGTDVLRLAGFSHDYRMAFASGAGVIAGGPEGGNDTLASIEDVQFTDGTLTLDLQSTAAQIVRLYDSFLGRAPDVAGFDSYLRLVAAGKTFQDLAANAAASAEFHDATAALSDADYIRYVYEHSLRREPDPTGLQNYLDALHDGALTRTSMIVQAAESPEHIALTAGVVGAGLWIPDEKVEGLELLYDAAVQRQPDATGIAAYSAELASGTSFRQIANQMASSAEFHRAHDAQTDAQYIDSLYVAEVGRHADAPGLAAYLDELAHGHTRGDLLYETAMSQEHQSHVLAFYDPLLIGA